MAGFIHAWRGSADAVGGFILARMDHSVAAVQYRRVWRGFAPRG